MSAALVAVVALAANGAEPAPPSPARPQPGWEDALAWARQDAEQRALARLFDAETILGPVGIAEQQVVLSSVDGWGERRRRIVLRWPVADKDRHRLQLRYRAEPAFGLTRQLALLRLRDTKSSLEQLLSKLKLEELTQFPTLRIAAALQDDLSRTTVPLLNSDGDMICLHGPEHAVEYWSGPERTFVYGTSMCGNPPALSALLDGWFERLHAAWIERESPGAFASLLDGIDLASDGAAWFNAACEAGNLDLARVLLDRGVPAANPDPEGRLPLSFAAQAGSPELVARLLAAGADPNRGGWIGMPPLLEAIQSGSRATIELLLAHGARFDESEEAPLTPLGMVSRQRRVDLGLWLFEKGARVDADDLLVACAQVGRDDALDRTIALAGPFKPEDLGRALIAAVEEGHDPTALHLLALGAPVTDEVMNERGKLQPATIKALEAKRPTAK